MIFINLQVDIQNTYQVTEFHLVLSAFEEFTFEHCKRRKPKEQRLLRIRSLTRYDIW